tara:strand:- start:8913 stop:10187 length:1275 start_codon:yes stop_codon:yes gene_type:complete
MPHKIHPHLQNLKQSATLAINKYCGELETSGKTIFRFGLGQSPFPVPDSIVSSLEGNAYRKDYLPVEGLYALRQAVAEFHQKIDKTDFEPEGIMIGPGSKELVFTLQLAMEGSTLIPSPCWVSYGPQGQIVHREIHYIQTQYENNWRLLPDQLESAIHSIESPHMLILNYPGNPDGGTYTPEELSTLAAVCRKNDVLVLSDEIYGRMHHQGDHISIARYYPEGTIVSSGLSKWCGAGGWRLGHFAFPRELYGLKNVVASISSETFSCVSTPIQYAAVQAYTDYKTVDEYLIHSRRLLSIVGSYCANSLAKAGVRVRAPSGAFYLFPDFENFREKLTERGITNSPTLCEQLLQDTGVALLSGSEFGRDATELNARLAYINFDGRKALKISRKIPTDKTMTIDDIIPVCANLIEAIERIIKWLQAY